MLMNPDYRGFLEHACPNSDKKYPSEKCNIIGTWDDHDFSWNDGDGRLVSKYDMKQVYLDAIGEPQKSDRRNRNRGIYTKYSYNSGQLDVVLLDERYQREPLPCHMRNEACEQILSNNQTENR
eukprot:UN27024